VSANVSVSITESYDDFTEDSTVIISKDVILAVTESYADFSESISVSFPISITVNPKNIIRVKRKSNSVIIKRKSNIIRVK